MLLLMSCFGKFFYIRNVKKNEVKILTSKSKLLCWFWVIRTKISSFVVLRFHCDNHQSPKGPYWNKLSLRNACMSFSLVMENWQTPGCAQRDCDFTSHSISNILLLWIKSSQSESVSACACLFGEEMLFRGILFVVVVERYDIKWA